jgi:AcrR family transcriptional regulator
MAENARKKAKPPRSSGLQAAKSAATRTAAIEGAIECLIKTGYARTSTIEIAKRANVSRGAMIYHFPTKRRLLDAIVEYIIAERIRQFTDAMRSSSLTEEDRRDQKGIDVYWQHLHSRLFTAFHELVVASRTDPELARVMRVANTRFEREWHKTVKELFPEWKDKGPLFDLAMDVTQFLLEGMALNKFAHDARQRRERIRDYLKSRLREIFLAGENPDKKGAVQEFMRSAKNGNKS